MSCNVLRRSKLQENQSTMIYSSIKALAGVAIVLNSGVDAYAPVTGISKDAMISARLRRNGVRDLYGVSSLLSSAVSRSSLKMAVTDAPPQMGEDVMVGGGMFTTSSPESRRVTPTNLEGKTKFKVVYVVLESQYQSSLTKACNSINEGKEGVAIEAVGYLLEELRNPATLEKFREDVASANIFIGSLIFVQELADKVEACLC